MTWSAWRSSVASAAKERRSNGYSSPTTPLRQHYPDLENPFVYRIFFTDGASIWAGGDDDHAAVIELVGKRRGQYVWPEAIKTFAKEIRWSEGQPAKAIGWRLTPWSRSTQTSSWVPGGYRDPGTSNHHRG